MTAYGTSAWGTSGFGLTPDLSIVHAYANSTHTVLVTLTKPPQAINALLPSDVLNKASWLIERLDTGEVIELANIAAYSAPLIWQITTLGQLPESGVQLRVTAIGLKDAGGAYIQLPRSAEFAGITEIALSTPPQLAATRGVSFRDLTNLPTPTINGVSESIGGTLKINGGDYTLVSGVELVKKLVIRRLTTTPGDFFHLPKYGVGLQIKQAIPAGDLIKLKTLITNQILLEPDIDQCTVDLAQATNLLVIKVRALIRGTGQEVNVAINSQIGSVRL
jgi:hypothetical protein